MNITPSEAGLSGPPLPPPGELPPNDGKFAPPFYFEFSALVNTASRTYLSRFDEAVRNGKCNSLAMLNDGVIKPALFARMMPTAQLTFHIDADEPDDPAQADAAETITRIIERIPRFQQLKMSLLWAIWYGRAGATLTYKWRPFQGKVRLVPVDHRPINGDTLKFKWDGTTIGVLVHSAYPGETESTDQGMAHFFTPAEREAVIYHRHNPEAADFTQADYAGRVMGVGLRNDLYWIWMLKMQVFALMTNYLERYSNGFTIFYYDAQNPRAKQEAIEAAKQQFSNVAMIYPKWPGGENFNGVQRLEVGTASPALLNNLIDGYFDRIIEKAILGQELTHTTAPTGLGSGVAAEHGKTFDQIIKYDAVNLEDTLQSDLVDVLYSWNFPGMAPGRLTIECDTPNVTEILENAQVMYSLGMSLDEETIRDVTKIPAPKPGSQVISKVAPMQPAAVGGVPAGVPAAGPAGPPEMAPDAGEATQEPAQAQVVQQSRKRYSRRWRRAA